MLLPRIKQKIKISKCMEEPPKLGDYNVKRDPDEHVQVVNDRLNYFSADDASKCKLFVLTLVGSTMLWFNGLSGISIESWTNFCE